MITISHSELKNLIKEAISETRQTGGGSIFNRGNYIKKKKHELHMSFSLLREKIEPHISAYHPMPDQYEFASVSRYDGGASLFKLPKKFNPHDIARTFALMCFGVSTNRDLEPDDEGKAAEIYTEVIDLFFKHYESHLVDKFSQSPRKGG